jgi:nicotinamidase-related amidase
MNSPNRINKQNSALLLIEFQQEWLSKQGKLHHLFIDKEQFSSSVEAAKEVITAARHISLPIIHSGLHYSNKYKELGKEAKYGLRATINTHQTFLATSVGSQFVEPFNPRENEFVVSGRTGASAFAGSNLDSYLRNNRINTLFIWDMRYMSVWNPHCVRRMI